MLDQPRLAEHAGGQVDGDAQRRVDAPGLCHVAQAGVDAPPGQLGDQPGALGHRDEAVRRDPAKLRIIPAAQGLGADHPAVLHVQDRLQPGFQLVGAQGFPQAGIGDLQRLLARLVDRDRPLLALQGTRERVLCVAQQGRGVASVCRGGGHPDHDRVHHLGAAKGKRLLEGARGAVTRERGVLDVVQAGEQRDEFELADPVQAGAGAKQRAQALVRGFAELVARGVAVHLQEVADPLQAHQHHAGHGVRPGAGEHGLQRLDQRPAVHRYNSAGSSP